MGKHQGRTLFRHLGPQRVWIGLAAALLLVCGTLYSQFKATDARKANPAHRAWVQSGFKDFIKGRFDDGGSNLYVNSKGIIEMINDYDVNNDGYPDIVLADSHDYIERGPTWIYQPDQEPGNWVRRPIPNYIGRMNQIVDVDGGGYPDYVVVNSETGATSELKSYWARRQMPNESGWMSRIIDVDRDGYPDLVVVNGENGVTSDLDSYVYWGGPQGLTDQREELPTEGAYDVAACDINHDGLPDLIFPSAWRDHHDPGQPHRLRVYLQEKGRKFIDATRRYNLIGVAAVAVACGDLNGDGYPDLVVGNFRTKYNTNTDSFVYWGTQNGFDTKSPLRLPTHGVHQVILTDMNNNGRPDIVFAGGRPVQIYWNRKGKFSVNDQLQFNVLGPPPKGKLTTVFTLNIGTVHAAVADLDGDGKKDLAISTEKGVQIRSGKDLTKIATTLPAKNATWITAADLNGDGRPDLIVSRYDNGSRYDTRSPIFWNGASGFSPRRVSWVPTRGAMGNTAGILKKGGRPDVIFNNTMSGPCCGKGVPSFIYLGNKEAQYSVKHRLAYPTSEAYQAAVADLDLDGYPEVIFTNGNDLRIFHGSPNGPMPDRYVDLPTKAPIIQDVLVADFNHDGYLDLLSEGSVYDTRPETLAKSAQIFYGSKDGFSPSRSEGLSTYGGIGYIADVNRDGYLDVLFADRRGYVLIYLGGPHGYSKDHVWKVPCPALEMGGAVNVADLNKDGWLDLIVSTMGHYVGLKDTLHIFYGSPHGFSPERSQAYLGGYSPVYTAVADFNRDGNLDLITTAYSTSTTRVIPAQLFWGNGKTIDFKHPVNLPAESSSDVMQDDLNRDGWIDIVLSCHRNNIGHEVNSLIYWNGPKGFSPSHVTRFPGMGPHGIVAHDRGNAYTRKPEETYTSVAYDMGNETASKLSWKADVTSPLALKFQLRWAATKEQLRQAKWMGPNGEGTYYERSGEAVRPIPTGAHWLQYRAVFVSPYGCGSPKLREVRVDLKHA